MNHSILLRSAPGIKGIEMQWTDDEILPKTITLEGKIYLLSHDPLDHGRAIYYFEGYLV